MKKKWKLMFAAKNKRAKKNNLTLKCLIFNATIKIHKSSVATDGTDCRQSTLFVHALSLPFFFLFVCHSPLIGFIRKEGIERKIHKRKKEQTSLI